MAKRPLACLTVVSKDWVLFELARERETDTEKERKRERGVAVEERDWKKEELER